MSGQAVVIGASGGIGRALVRCLVESDRFDHVHALARRQIEIEGAEAGYIDLDDEESIARAASVIGPEIGCLIVASGLLHGPGMKPERSLGDLNAEQLTRIFATNTIGPALVLKHFAPMTAKDRRVTIALLSARVGSISDNRLGGWYGYRASKTALNMIVKCAAIELARSRPQAICVALHPGTVDTKLSKPFQRGVPPHKLFTAAYSAECLTATLDRLDQSASGQCFAWDGSLIAR
ncbi:SDR family NAD(P)-dependent oxidoreductase [Sphingomonas oryzagri]|uniref:SDR family NAD(P)-dependent oxidoreductase n=1 Tax=Sphingomonas oryzagri TaxID=3042314 RepID=A0ABT6N3Q0_9SPHN|nr:SDR family NAD(P)-dependent oxidoreductase [Sphingomonas oryzagri]MDH7639394.1 SDR family NAD(P)-dependent oxidoreductase [Sphingomonas oryzagri]